MKEMQVKQAAGMIIKPVCFNKMMSNSEELAHFFVPIREFKRLADTGEGGDKEREREGCVSVKHTDATHHTSTLFF